MNIYKLTEKINEQSKEIVDNLNYESISVYKFLKDEFKKSNVTKNLVFQFVFRSFYRLDMAGLTKVFKTEYFKIMENSKTKGYDISEILKKLYAFENIKGQENIQFSFTTKMINMLNDNEPIYDNLVAKKFKIHRPNHYLTYDKKVKKYLADYDMIKQSYNKIQKENLLKKVVKEFDEKFKDNQLSYTKKLDFIFWSVGKLEKRRTHNTIYSA